MELADDDHQRSSGGVGQHVVTQVGTVLVDPHTPHQRAGQQLMWHAELGQSLTDVWTGDKHRGVQLHDLREAVVQLSLIHI